MRILTVSALLAVLVACDDNIWTGGGGGYDPDWFGVQVFMVDYCVQCHPTFEEPDWPEDLEQDVRDGTGFYVVAGDPEASLLWRVVSGDVDEGEVIMPPGGPLPPVKTQHIYDWIEAGAPL